jgi:hypothetical protein
MKEVSPKRIVFPAHGAVGLANKLGDDMQVSNLPKKLRKTTKTPIDVYLLQMSLTEKCRIGFVVLIGPLYE